MKRKVVITVEIDPTQYHGVEDTAAGAILIAMECLKGLADLPPGKTTIECQGTHTEIIIP